MSPRAAGAKSTYRGRFAPSPTGPLHQGSLSAALASYLDAHKNNGIWLLRIEDTDPPREDPDAKQIIPFQLEGHGLYWDEDISYQSERDEEYHRHILQLLKKEKAYRCTCSRQRVAKMGESYNRHCLKSIPGANEKAALRLKIDGQICWRDLIQGDICFQAEKLGGDFVIHRKDGLFSYQLATAIDDHCQNITHVIRGADLLDSTARQGFLMRALDWQPPEYGHTPLVYGDNGQKLSKQNMAPALEVNQAVKNLYQALSDLGQMPPPELANAAKEEVLLWAIEHWQIRKVPKGLSTQ